jgi:hypothetical protein
MSRLAKADRAKSHVQPNRPHQGQSVALSDHAFAQHVVEAHLSILKVFLKMDIVQLTIQRSANLSQRQIMRTHESDSASIQESVNDALCANATII